MMCPASGPRAERDAAFPGWSRLPPLNGVTPPSGKLITSAPLSVVKAIRCCRAAHVFQLLEDVADVVVQLFHAGFLDTPVLTAGLADHASYLSDSTVVTCMRAGLYQTKNGLLVFFGSLRSRKSMTWDGNLFVDRFDRSRVNGPSSLQVWFAAVPSEDLHQSTGRGGVRHTVVWGSTAPGTSGRPGMGASTAEPRSAQSASC